MSETNAGFRGPFQPLSSASLAIAGTALVCMVVVEAWQVVARYVFNDSPSWTEPVVLLLLNVAMMFSAAVAVRNNTHFAFRIFLDHTSGKLHTSINVFVQLMVILVGVLFCGFGIVIVADTWPVKLAGAQMRQGMLYVPLTVGGALMVLFAAERIFVELTGADASNATGESA